MKRETVKVSKLPKVKVTIISPSKFIPNLSIFFIVTSKL